MEISLGGWRFRTNPAENARGNVPYLCACQSCRNFLAAVETLPGETHAFFRRLGWTSAAPRRRCTAGRWGRTGAATTGSGTTFPGSCCGRLGTRPPIRRHRGRGFCPGEERRMAPLAGEVHMDAFLRLPFVLDEAWED